MHSSLRLRIIAHHMQIKWEGEIRDGSGAAVGTGSGKLHLPYIAEENRGEDPELVVLLDKDGPVPTRLKEVVILSSLCPIHSLLACTL